MVKQYRIGNYIRSESKGRISELLGTFWVKRSDIRPFDPKSTQKFGYPTFGLTTDIVANPVLFDHTGLAILYGQYDTDHIELPILYGQYGSDHIELAILYGV
jgi:hypothetical protein